MNGGFIALFSNARAASIIARVMMQPCLEAFADFGLGRAIVALRTSLINPGFRCHCRPRHATVPAGHFEIRL
jgi:hypothetical protein